LVGLTLSAARGLNEQGLRSGSARCGRKFMARGRAAKVLGYVAASLIAAAIVAALGIYIVSERVIHHRYAISTEPPIDVPTDAASIAEGERLARIRGCNGGCHGKRVGGHAWDDGWREGRAMAPDLALVARNYSTAELVHVIRNGVRPNGEGVEIMPSPMFYHLSDADLGRIIAFLRSEPVTDAHTYTFEPGPHWRWQMATDEWAPWAPEIATLGPRLAPPPADDPVRLGEYLARTSCTECHGNTLEGQGGTPNLSVAAAYAPADFVRLMRTGVALGERDVGLMGEVARGRFAHFTDAEIAALHVYLQHRAQPSP
jgi:cytochrome c553